jgi:hypothetical protein
LKLYIFGFINTIAQKIHTVLKMSPKDLRKKHNQRNLSKLTVSNNRGI